MLLSRRQITRSRSRGRTVATPSMSDLAAIVAQAAGDPHARPPRTAAYRVPAQPRIGDRSGARSAHGRPRPRRFRSPPRLARSISTSSESPISARPSARSALLSCSTPTAAGSPATSSPTAAAPIPSIPASCSVSRTSPAPKRRRAAPTSPAIIIPAIMAARCACAGSTHSNSNAELRAIVVHSAPGMRSPACSPRVGRLGRSEGCFALVLCQPPGTRWSASAPATSSTPTGSRPRPPPPARILRPFRAAPIAALRR